jgi:hypothetical protein
MQMEEDRQTCTTPQENFKQMWVKYGKSHFWSPGCSFRWWFYGGNYINIFWGSSIELGRPDGKATFTRLSEASTRYYPLFRLLRASAVQKV